LFEFVYCLIGTIVLYIGIVYIVGLHQENKRLRKWKNDRIELDRKLSEEAFENIRLSCEEIQKSLEEQSKYFEEKCKAV
jgi:uncharacterized membrane protein